MPREITEVATFVMNANKITKGSDGFANLVSTKEDLTSVLNVTQKHVINHKYYLIGE